MTKVVNSFIVIETMLASSTSVVVVAEREYLLNLWLTSKNWVWYSLFVGRCDDIDENRLFDGIVRRRNVETQKMKIK